MVRDNAWAVVQRHQRLVRCTGQHVVMMFSAVTNYEAAVHEVIHAHHFIIKSGHRLIGLGHLGTNQSFSVFHDRCRIADCAAQAVFLFASFSRTQRIVRSLPARSMGLRQRVLNSVVSL